MPGNRQSGSTESATTSSSQRLALTKIGPLFDSGSEHSRETRDSFAEAIRICGRLRDAGHVAYFAGGCVRDALLGREPKDFDVATDATPDRVRGIFGHHLTLSFGASFGVIAVLPENRASETGATVPPTEVATFRSDGQYSDGRRPDKVHYGDARHDALRRDFTINGLFFDPETERVIDYVGGQEDLAARRLRTIGSAAERFDEDKLRMLRAVRFATTLGFMLESTTQREIGARAAEISVVSAERIGAEMRRIVGSLHACRGLQLLAECGLDRFILPDLKHADPRRLESYLSHRATLALESSMALIAEVIAENHPVASVQSLIDDLATRWRLSNEERRRILFALKHWALVAQADRHRWSAVQPVLIDRDTDCAMQVATAIVAATGSDRSGIELCQQALGRPSEQLDPPPLITGETLREAGHRPGPNFRLWLQSVRDAQLDGEISSTAEALAMLDRM
jgi:tRNA nucleotidyltransferase (CCA-adding enzyme)